jgi:hypothetical protein
VRPYQFAGGLVTCELSFLLSGFSMHNVPLDLMTSEAASTGERRRP